MMYDLLHLPGPPVGGCGQTYIDDRLDESHDRGDRVAIVCKCCGRYGEHEIRAPLTGLARFDVEGSA